MKLFLYVVAFLMIVITGFGFFPSYANFIFAGGSDGLMNIVSANIWFQIIVVSSFLLSIYKYNKTMNAILILIFFLWCISGRMVSLFPDGRLSSGWFYLETDRINICKNEEIDCDRIFFYETEIEELPFWRLRIKNKNINSVIFIGPVIWSNTLSLFRYNFPRFEGS